MTSLLEVKDLKKIFPMHGGFFGRVKVKVYAVDGVSFSIEKGETLGLVGESGCGKSTLGKLVLKLLEPTSGEVILKGYRINQLSQRDMRPHRRVMQVVFQDPYASLNQRMVAGDIVGEPLENFSMFHSRVSRQEKVISILEKVGLRPDAVTRYPHEFSGGQRQRLGIARALSVDPELIVADEPVSALDVSVQAQVINLMTDLQEEFGFSYLFIAHDLAVVRHISHRVGVMYLGKLVELADKKDIFTQAQHPYTKALLAAIPITDPRLRRKRSLLQGDIPSPMMPPRGCNFNTRCPVAISRCFEEEPKFREIASGHHVACHII